MHRLSLAALLLLPATALAVPSTVHHQGRINDALGAALTGDHDLDFNLYDAPSGGAAVWTEALTTVAFDNGYFAVTLGQSSAFDAATLGGYPLYMGLAVDGGAELPGRIELNSVPYAILADSAASADTVVAGATIDASEILINGTTVIDGTGSVAGDVPWSSVTGAPTVIGSLGCAIGQIAEHDGSAWACVDHTHDAADTVSGTFSVARLPVGTSSADVAAGDHVHNAVDLTSGVLDVARIPVGTSSADVAAGDHVHGAAQITSGVLDVARVPVGPSSTEVAAGDHAHSTAGGGGSGASDAGTSCLHLHIDDPTLADGVYWVDPAGGGSSTAFETWCDMTTDGGGWSLVYNHNYTKANRTALQTSIAAMQTASVNPDGPDPYNNFRVALQDWNGLSAKSEVLFKVGGRVAGPALNNFWIKQTNTTLNPSSNHRIEHTADSLLSASDSCLSMDAFRVHTFGPYQHGGGSPGAWQAPAHCSGDGVPFPNIGCWCLSMGNNVGRVTPTNCGSNYVAGNVFYHNNLPAKRCATGTRDALGNSQYESVGMYVR